MNRKLIALWAVSLVVASAGGATAGGLITGSQVKDGSLTGYDIKDGSITLRDLAPSIRPAAQGWGGCYVRPDGVIVCS